MKELEQMLTTLDIAEMMGMRHDRVLRKLEGQDVNGKHVKGIIEIMTEYNLGVSDYFQESIYIDESGKKNKCYNLTRKGCEFLAHKFNGKKGIEFTARYIERFHQMEELIKQASQPKKSEQIRIIPEFSGKFIPEKQLAAEFIQDYIVENRDDSGLYRAYVNWCIQNNRIYITSRMFGEVKKKVVQLRLDTGNWKPSFKATQLLQNYSNR